MSDKKHLDRRGFLKSTALGAVGAGLAANGLPVNAQEKKPVEAAKARKYNMLGKTGFKVSDIALGGVSNVEVIKAMLDAGVNYIDTAESYDRGKSEIAFGQAIKGRDRKKIFINTKLHVKDGETKESLVERFNKCLERLGTPYVDSLMTHNPSSVAMAKYEPFFEACAQLIKEKKLRFTGISSHGPRSGQDQDSMDKILVSAAQDKRYAVMLLVYNFIQKEAGEKILKACKENNIGTTLMKTNPVGRYYSMKSRIESMEKDPKTTPERLKRMKSYYEDLKKKAVQGEWFIKKYNLTQPPEMLVAATRYCLTNPDAHTLLARTDTFDAMELFLSASGTTISDQEVKKLAAFTKGPGSLYCRHACGLCESNCPHNVPVNTIMRYNHYFEAQGREKHAMEKYAALPTAKADHCDSCSGFCQAKCPYGVPVHGLLAMAHENLSLLGA